MRTLAGNPPPGTLVIVDVYAHGRPNAVTFRHKWRYRNALRKDGRIEVPAKSHGDPPTPIKFILWNKTRPTVDLHFVNDDNAIWVDRTTCPTTAPARDPEIIDINPSGDELWVKNLNEDDCVLHYNLRFEPDPNRYHHDPEIKNGGSR